MTKYYIACSSIFDGREYRLQVYRDILDKAGATTFITRLNGWQNQPEVVGFYNITMHRAEDLLRNLPEFKKWGPIIPTVSWKVPPVS